MTRHSTHVRGPDLYDLIRGTATARLLRRSIGVGAFNFAVMSMWLALDTDVGPTHVALRVFDGVAGVVTAIGAAMWVTTDRMFRRRPSVLFGVFGLLGTAGVLSTLPDPVYGLLGCALLSVIGVQFTLLMATPWLTLHLLVSAVTIGAITARGVTQEVAPRSAIALATYVIAVSVMLTPWSARLAWSRLLVYAARSRSDPLTGLLNRSGLDHAVERLTDQGDDALSVEHAVAVLDIDRFKAVNDLHGHVVGDRVIREVAAALDRFGSAVGAAVARTGGEEFTLLIPTAGRSLDEIGGRLPLRTAGIQGPTVTLSAGIVRLPDGTSRHSTLLAATLTAADRMMYQAKRAGGGTYVTED